MNAAVPYQDVPIDDLAYDPDNPRIQHYLRNIEEPGEADIKLALGASSPDPNAAHATTFRSLKESIKAKGGIINPIIVQRCADGELKVIEGNTRLMIFHELHDQEFPGDWSTIPAIVHESIDEENIDAIRMLAHLVGPRPWGPYAKARFLHDLSKKENMSMARIIEYNGGRDRETNEYISAFCDMEEYYRPLCKTDSEFNPDRFSAFAELQRPAIQRSLLDSGFNKEDYARWVKERKFKQIRRVRDLPRVLANEEGKKVFLKEGIESAILAIQTPASDAVLAEATILQLCRELTQRLLKITREEEKNLSSDRDSESASSLLYLQEELGVICDRIDDRD